MKANTNREGRLNFDTVVDAYDDARPRIPVPLVEEIMRATHLSPADAVLEIGAATGQLTRSMRHAGLRVVALEPGAQLRQRLADLLPGDDGLTLRGEFFEDYPGAEGPFPAIWSANAFHWVDPAVSYARSAELLEPGGHLVLLWTYPILRDPVQKALNETVLVGDIAHSAWDPDTFRADLDELTGAGRVELVESGAYEEPRHWWTTDLVTLDVETYVAYLTSFGHVAALDAAARARLGADTGRVLAELGVERLELTNHLYTCVAQVR